jgi:hypothetical protein
MARKNVSSTDVVTVACKLPSGLHIISHEHGIDIKLHGAGSPFAIGGHGMTQGIPADKWALVEEVYKDAKWLTSEAVFAMNKPQDASDKATDRKDERVGFEGINPNDPNSGLPRNMRIQVDGADDLGR